jgi:hypothetical protein
LFKLIKLREREKFALKILYKKVNEEHRRIIESLLNIQILRDDID